MCETAAHSIQKEKIPKNNILEADRRRAFNEVLKQHRVTVEHAICRIKQFRIVSSVYRHDIVDFAQIIRLCACLAQRRKRICEEL